MTRQYVTVKSGGGEWVAALVMGVVGVVAVTGVLALAILGVIVLAVVGTVGAVAAVSFGAWKYAQYRAVRDAAVELWREDHPPVIGRDGWPVYPVMPRRRVVLELERLRQARLSRGWR